VQAINCIRPKKIVLVLVTYSLSRRVGKYIGIFFILEILNKFYLGIFMVKNKEFEY
jgi:hypothetical protein